jgi:hypothetical protein
MGIGNWISTIALTPALQNEVKAALKAFSDELSSNFALKIEGDQIPRLTSVDRRIGMGITRNDGKIALALLVEKSESLAERKAEALTQVGERVRVLVVGSAHSSAVDKPVEQNFGRHAGTSIGHIRGNPGSVGCMVTVKSGHRDFLCLTSAAHVLSMLNQAEPGDPIILPGYPDGPNVLENRIGSLLNYTFLNHYADTQDWANVLNGPDVAIVKLANAQEWPDTTLVPSPDDPGKLKRVHEVVGQRGEALDYIGKTVFKIGRTTGMTRGIVEAIGIEQTAIRLPNKRLYMYRDLIAIKGCEGKPFSEPGDSGALVYTQDFRALGFVVGGSDSFSFACSAARCLNDMKAKLV